MNLFYFTKHSAARLLAAVAVFSMVAGMLPIQALAANTGAIWTTTGGCGTPQNANSYEVGDVVYINGSNFASSTYAWSIKPAAGGANAASIASGNITVDNSGAFCFAAKTLTTGDIGGPYKADVDGKNDNFSVVEAPIPGCTDPLANNYNPAATASDASCTYDPVPVPGCTDPLASNYNPLATTDDGSCVPVAVPGCTNPLANNFNPTATVDDASCTFDPGPILGCTNPLANNFNVAATQDDASCTFDPAPQLCTVEIVSNTDSYVVEKSANALALSFINPGWTAVIGGATWIWGDNPVVDPTQNETQTFQNKFGFVGTVTSATLYIASDNGHSATLNTSAAGSDSSDNNFQVGTQDEYDVMGLIAQGNNELDIVVNNKGVANSVPAGNPAGVLYKLVIEGKVTSDSDCSVDFVPPAPTCSDGIMNQDETGIDTGGVCTVPPVETCSDGIMNQDETGVDTGGICGNGGGGTGPDPVCTIGNNLLLNGSFEDPVISSSWTLSAVTDWMVTKVLDSTSTLGEIWRGFGVGPSDGNQNLELAAAGSTQLTQTVVTTPGATYELRFDFAARGANVSDNNVDALIDGNILINANTDVTDWTTYTDTFVAVGTTTEIALRDADVSNNSTGSLVDNAVLCYVSDPVVVEEDTYEIYGYVWHDNNRNTAWDDRNENGENPLLGWSVSITNGTTTLSTTTDANGYYEFEVPEGVWTITETVENGWERTTQASHVVTVPEVQQVSLLGSVMNFIIPTAHAAVVDRIGEFNFGNDEVRGGGGGGRATRTSASGTVLGDSIDAPTPEPLVLGEQVSAVPTGAPDAGAGGTSPALNFFSNTWSALLTRSRRHG